MLFKRYASPFLLLDRAIATGSFDEFVDEFISIINKEIEEETQWQFYLHKIYDMTYEEYLGTIKQPEKNEKPVNFEVTIQDSYDIINGFDPGMA